MADAVFKKIEARLSKVDTSDRKLLHVYKFKITDDSGNVTKTWVLDLVNLKLTVGDGDAECTLIAKEQVLIDITNGKMDAAEALRKDMIDVEGNLELIGLLKPYVDLSSA